MLLKNKNAIIYGAGGAIGGAVARAFAREGATVFLTGHTLTPVDAVAKDIIAAGGVAEAAQFASYGVRAVCLRSTGIPETATIDVVFGLHAKAMGITQEQFQKLMEGNTHTRRSTTLETLTNVAVFMASDLASGMTGTIANLTGGKEVD